MPKPNHLDDTIVAIATAATGGGIGIIRLSGKKSILIADKIFLGKSKIKPSEFKSYMMYYGWIAKPKLKDEIVDEVLLTVMRAPKSYTREDIVEISCHGGVVPLRVILNLAVDLGARLAEPGEFTKRAFLNGRIDLAQAEAVIDIISAKTESFLKSSMGQLKGELTLELERIRESLMNIYTEIEAILNFPEDDIDASSRKEIFKKIQETEKQITQLLESSAQGRILKEGIKVVLCGRPNVGKSSLLNALLKESRAIVTEIAGTTRDTIEETTQIQGVPFTLVDTAGILKPRDLIEEEAVKRSHHYIEGADLILFVLDNSCALTKEDEALMEKIKNRPALIVLNKCDLPSKLKEKDLKEKFQGQRIIKVSALKRQALKDLEGAIVDFVFKGKIFETPKILISNARHIASLKEAQKAMAQARDAFLKNKPLELISEDIKLAVDYLDRITGRQIDSDLLDKIFSEFCIGK